MKLIERLSLCRRILCVKPGNPMIHAERELPPANGDEMQELMNKQLKEVILVFCTHEHSGFSASYAASALEKLLRFKPLRPLTGEDSEWREPFEDGGSVQNTRSGNVFKGDPHRFNGDPYDSTAIVFREKSGLCFQGRGSAQPIAFPYTPKVIYLDVDDEGMPLNGWDREGVYSEWLKGVQSE